MKKNTSGFTIIEVLVIVIVIGILASIVVISYNHLQAQARNTEREVEVKGWVTLLRKYKSLHGTYPTVPSGTGVNYCLGTGFPKGPDDQPRCRNSATTDSSVSYLESGNTALMNALRSVGTLPKGNRTPIKGDLVGPYIPDYSTTNPRIRQVFEGGSGSCPQGLTETWTDGSATICAIYVNQ